MRVRVIAPDNAAAQRYAKAAANAPVRQTLAKSLGPANKEDFKAFLKPRGGK